MRKILQVVGVRVGRFKVLEVDRQAGVDGIALQMDDARLREGRVDQAEGEKVGGQLVDYACGSRRLRMQQLKIGVPEAREPRERLS